LDGEECDNSRQKCIEVDGFKISSEADKFEENTDYAGVIIYGGNYRGIRPGYTILIKMPDQGKFEGSKGLPLEKQIQRYAMQKAFGLNLTEMNDLMKSPYNMKFTGFSIRNNELQFNSLLFQGLTYHYTKEIMAPEEEVVVKTLVKVWKQHGPGGKSYMTDNPRTSDFLNKHICQVLEEEELDTVRRYYDKDYYPQCRSYSKRFCDGTSCGCWTKEGKCYDKKICYFWTWCWSGLNGATQACSRHDDCENHEKVRCKSKCGW